MGDPWFGLAGGRSLHDWLLDSAYVRSKDDARHTPKRKKGKGGSTAAHPRSSEPATSTLSGAGGGATLAHHQDDSSARGEPKAATPGKRKVRRMLNDRLLRELAGPLEAADISALYAPPPWGGRKEKTVLERVTGVGMRGSCDHAAAAAWEPFRANVDMDRQDQLLSHRPTGGHSQREGTAVSAWRGVEKRGRDALKRCYEWPLVHFYEEELLAFLRAEGAPERRHDGEDDGGGAGGADNGAELIVQTEAPYHRLLLHGLCQFHGLLAHTLHSDASASASGEAEGDGTVVCVSIRRRRPPPGRAPLAVEAPPSRPVRLVDFLSEGEAASSMLVG